MRLPRQRPFMSSTPWKSLAYLPRAASMPPISRALAGMSPPPRRLGWHSRTKSAPAMSTRTSLPFAAFCRIGTLRALRDGADQSGQGRHLAEPGGVEVFERVEIDDHAVLALRDLARQQPMPIAGAGGAL